MSDRTKTPGAALVTGAGRRIGRALALTLAELGYDVGVHYNGSRDDAAAVGREIERLGRKSLLLPADLSQEDQVMPLITQMTAALGPVTCLINNASIFERDEALDATKESWDAHQAINLRAPFVLMQEMARTLPSAAEGVIVNLLDQRVWNLTPHFISYTVSKTGLWTLTQTMALALAPRIRVNAIGPGPTLPSPRQSQEQFDAQCRAMPLCRGTSPDEISAALRLILVARGMTGQMIALDGGQHLAWSFPAKDAVPED